MRSGTRRVIAAPSHTNGALVNTLQSQQIPALMTPAWVFVRQREAACRQRTN